MNRKKLLAFFLTAVLAANVGFGCPTATEAAEQINQTVKTVTEWKDVPYATISAKQKLDIYLPKTGKGPYPVIVAFHGMGGDKNSAELKNAMEGLNRGYAVVCANYREPGEVHFLDSLADARAAVKFVRANADKYGFDSSRIAAWGDSLGGKLAVFLGTTADHPELDDPALGYAGESCRVSAVVALFPALDDVNADADMKKLGLTPSMPRSDEKYGRKMYGAPIQSIPGLVALANPIRYVNSSAVPFLIMHGTADSVCPVSQSQELAEKLRHNIGSGKVNFITVEGAGHHVADFSGEEYRNKMFKFLYKHLKIKAMLKQQREKNKASR